MRSLQKILEQAVEEQASDIFLVAGGALSFKIAGKIVAKDEEKLTPEETRVYITEIFQHEGRDQTSYIATGDDDFSFAIPQLARFRVNTYFQRGSQAAVIRIVAFEIPDYKELGIAEEVMNVAKSTHGLVIISGTAGSGKSTTQACMIDYINKHKNAHVITLEDPIEYLHRNDKSIISQREIAIDTNDYLSALRACLRQAPDVILLGEMRDYETIHTAMTAAETGHLVIATLHTKGAVSTIDRIIDSFPSNQQSQIRIQLSMVLNSVISQQLLPKKDGGMVPAMEIMHMTPAIRNMIRDSKNYQIENVIQSGNELGMVTMDQSIFKLYENDIIEKNCAVDYAINIEQMQRKTGNKPLFNR
ncbi:MAG: PilT/PilU family type 4a pilus ATPase [Lachnospiraceae bacterium]